MMGVDRTDYLMWGAMIDPDRVDWDEVENEIDGSPDKRFDLVYDGMCGKYAVAGVIISRSDQYEGFPFTEITDDVTLWRTDVVSAVRKVYPEAVEFKYFMFTRWH